MMQKITFSSQWFDRSLDFNQDIYPVIEEIQDGTCLSITADPLAIAQRERLAEKVDDLANVINLRGCVSFFNQVPKNIKPLHFLYNLHQLSQVVCAEQMHPFDEELLTKILHAFANYYPKFILGYEDYLSIVEPDFTFEVSDGVNPIKEFKAHEGMLRGSDNHWAKMFESGMQETVTRKTQIEIDNLEAFETILKFLYTGRLEFTYLQKDGLSHYQSITAELHHLSNIKKICEIYHMGDLHRLCEERMNLLASLIVKRLKPNYQLCKEELTLFQQFYKLPTVFENSYYDLKVVLLCGSETHSIILNRVIAATYGVFLRDRIESLEKQEPRLSLESALDLYSVAILCEKGLGTPKNLELAFNLYELAAAKDCTAALHSLGWCYDAGIGVPQNLIKAFKLYQKAAERSFPPSQRNLGCLYQDSAERNDGLANYWLKKAADLGDVQVLLHLADRYYKKGGASNKLEAIRLYKLAAEKEVAQGLFNLAVMYHNGEGVEKNLNEALRLFGLAAEQGLISAQRSLNMLYSEGREGINKNMEEAARWLTLVAEQGDALDLIALAFLYVKGQGVEKNIKEAIRLYKLAANKENPAAECYVGEAYYRKSEEIEKYQQKAAFWFKRAAERGYSPGQYNLGLLYYHGNGVKLDRQEAKRLMTLAANKKEDVAIEFLRTHPF